MAIKGAADVGFITIAGREISGDLISISDKFERVVEEITGLGASVDSWQDLGLEIYTLDLEGFLNEATGKAVEALALTGERVLLYAPIGNVIGDDIVGANLQRLPFVKSPSQNALTRVTANYQSSEHEEGVLLAPHTSRSSSASQLASHDNTTGGSGTGVGYVVCSALALGGYTNITVIIQDSVNNSDWATYITFANITAVNASERKAESSAPNRYTRVLFTWNGSGSSELATIAVGFNRG